MKQNTMSTNQVFLPTSISRPSIISVAFPKEIHISPRTLFSSCESSSPFEMYNPSYAIIDNLIAEDILGYDIDIKQGDYLVAICYEGFRRLPPNFDLQSSFQCSTDSCESQENSVSIDRVITEKSSGDVFQAMMTKIKELEEASNVDTPLIIHLERYGWDARPNSWGRFLAARDGDVSAALQMLEAHETWKNETFPIDLTLPSLTSLLKLRAISEIDKGKIPTVYVNYAKLQSLERTQTPENVVKAFVISTEIVLAKCRNPRRPKSCQLIDLSGVGITTGFRVDILKKIYGAFEPNYPETLEKMIMYPISRTVAYMARTLLSFVNERTQKKFILTDSLDTVCEELGWDKSEVLDAGGIEGYAIRQDASGNDLIV